MPGAMLGLGKVKMGESPLSPWERGRHVDRAGHDSIPGAHRGVARRYSGGSKDRTVTSPRGWWRSECHEETLDTCNVARPVLSAHGTKMNKAQSTKSRGRDGHGNSNCSST